MKWLGRRSKYGNKPLVVDGNRFDSSAEFRRYCTLMLLQREGHISHLELHPRFRLEVNGVKVATYVADYAYFEGGKRVVEDCKSRPTITPVFRIKAKLMKAIYGVEIKLTGKGIA